jgi:hypothetical protein
VSADRHPEINRPLDRREYAAIVQFALDIGLSRLDDRCFPRRI